MHLSELKAQHVSQLLEMANTNNIEGANRLRKQELIFALLKNQAKKGESIFGDGVLEILPDGFGFLRSPDTSYLASTDDTSFENLKRAIVYGSAMASFCVEKFGTEQLIDLSPEQVHARVQEFVKLAGFTV